MRKDISDNVFGKKSFKHQRALWIPFIVSFWKNKALHSYMLVCYTVPAVCT